MNVYISLDSTAQSVGSLEIYNKLKAQNKPQLNIKKYSTLGLMWLEPLLELEHNNQRWAFRNVNEKNIDDILQNPQNSKNYLGNIEDQPYLKNQHRVIFRHLGKNDPTNIEDYIRLGGFLALKNSLSQSPQSIIDKIKKADIRGRGGAFFPAYIKWQTVLNESSDTKYVICNADEGDSGSFADRLIIENDPFSLIEAMIIAGIAVGAKEGIIYLRSEYTNAKNILQKAIDVAYKKNYLGKNESYCFDLKLAIGAGAYVCGEETALIESLENKRGLVRPRPPVPAISGLLDKPTLLSNVLSFIDIVRLLEGSRDMHTTPIQLSGACKQCGLFEVSNDITIEELISEFGVTPVDDVKAVQVGGPLGAFIPKEKFYLKLNNDELSKEGFILGHASVVVFDKHINMKDILLNLIDFYIHESCGKCTPCRIGQTRLKEILTDLPNNAQSNLNLLYDLLETMKEASLCALGGLTHLSVLSALKYFSGDFNIGELK
ncbi:NAD-dependent formate dehydrogenase beta subunit [Desulfurella amilsii]|uniref:NAD-dependent formate dehydrogenase beta subunit n=1 Tax=Desulfurella amilsii TaxID=1562698 RepID=A0A1X4XVR6_9BACT|nr:NADH-ubiquinone oxidoreductase-F iron-sulfur binding region domain-containing protein [Desulfurella amilsii]OSS41629.1 NAD-dependent formate dehydrogenase beta subunit [Desulfurella amilsii]